jgi:hypothetical protein
MLFVNVALVTIAVTIATMLITRHSHTRGDLLMRRRDDPPTLHVLIVCVDCSGEGRLPRKTCLDANGKCETCGGGSYVLASSFAMNLQARRFARGAVSGSRVVPFDPAFVKARALGDRIAV